MVRRPRYNSTGADDRPIPPAGTFQHSHVEPIMLPHEPDTPQSSSSSATASSSGSTGHTRRDVVRRGVKLAFVAPVISTFFARDAYAAGSNHSCYPTGHACPGAEPCCNGVCSSNLCP